MKHFREVSVPKLIQENCDKDERGLYVPFIVLKENGAHHFKINDEIKVMKCTVERRCSVCGTHLNDNIWFIGGPASVFHKRGAVADLPVHKECGEYSLQACPYMAYARYTSKTDIDKLYKQLEDKTVKLFNPTVDSDRVPMFCFVKTSDFSLHVLHTVVFKPVMPYLEVEFWNDGAQLSLKEGEKILREHFETKYELKDLDYEFQER
jgi:hypothetical protein